MLTIRGYFAQKTDLALLKEWLETNCMNAYSYSTILCFNNSPEHSSLTIFDKDKKTKIIPKIIEKFKIDDNEILIGTTKPDSYLYKFYIDTHPNFIFNFNGIKVQKEILMPHHKNLLIFKYTLLSAQKKVNIQLSPILSFDGIILKEKNYIKYLTKDNFQILFYNKNFNFNENKSLIEENDIKLYSIGDFNCELKDSEPAFLIIDFGDYDINLYDDAYNKEIDRRKKIIAKYKTRNEIYKNIILSLHNYIIKKKDSEEFLINGYFDCKFESDAVVKFMNGILYPLKKIDTIKNILIYYAGGNELLKNYANDTPLWFIYNAYNFIEHTGDWKFVKENLWDKIKLLVNFYITGSFGEIFMEPDGFLTTRFKDKKDIPNGKRIDLNILWYNVLRAVEIFAAKFTDIDYHIKSSEFSFLLKKNFFKKFWNEEKGYLNYCVDIPPDNQIDSSLRPNQILAFSLRFNDLLKFDTQKKILNLIEENLMNENGIKTLSDKSPIYDPYSMQNGFYSLNWLIEFIIAYLKINNFSSSSRKRAKFLIYQIEKKYKYKVIGHLPDGFSSDEKVELIGNRCSLAVMSSYARLIYEVLGKL